jgi:hypothetical protein
VVRQCRRFAVASEAAELVPAAASSTRSTAAIAGMCAAVANSCRWRSRRPVPPSVCRRRLSSRVVSGLEARGLVRRKADPSGSRAVTVVLTDQGRATFEGARPDHVGDVHENLLSILTEVEIRQLAASRRSCWPPRTDHEGEGCMSDEREMIAVVGATGASARACGACMGR